MEITIDTKKDSKEDIKKAVEFLRGFIGEGNHVESGGTASFQIPPAAENAMAIFGNSQGEPAKKEEPAVEKRKRQVFEEDKIEIIPY